MFSYQNIFNIIVWEICYLLSNRNKKLKQLRKIVEYKQFVKILPLSMTLIFYMLKNYPILLRNLVGFRSLIKILSLLFVLQR